MEFFFFGILRFASLDLSRMVTWPAHWMNEIIIIFFLKIFKKLNEIRVGGRLQWQRLSFNTHISESRVKQKAADAVAGFPCAAHRRVFHFICFFFFELIIILKNLFFQTKKKWEGDGWGEQVTLLRSAGYLRVKWGALRYEQEPTLSCRLYIDLSANSFHYPITRLWSIVSISQDAGGLSVEFLFFLFFIF